MIVPLFIFKLYKRKIWRLVPYEKLDIGLSTAFQFFQRFEPFSSFSFNLKVVQLTNWKGLSLGFQKSLALSIKIKLISSNRDMKSQLMEQLRPFMWFQNFFPFKILSYGWKGSLWYLSERITYKDLWRFESSFSHQVLK